MCPPHLQRHAPLVCTKLWAAWLSRAEDGRSAQREEGPDVEVHNRSAQAYGPSEEDSGRVRCYRPGDEAIGVPVTVKSLRGLGISVLRDGPACAPQIVQLACSGCRHGYWSVVTWRVHTQNLLAIFFFGKSCPFYVRIIQVSEKLEYTQIVDWVNGNIPSS